MRINKVDIGNAPSAADVVFDNLRRAIISGELEDGQALRQEELAHHFNTSRIPVREALTRLEQHGLVQIRRYHGYTVAGLSRQEVEEICHFRALLEGEVVARAVARMSEATFAKAKKYCEAFSKERDRVLWNDLNREFHYALYEESGLPYHLEAIHAALDKTERYLVDQLTLTAGMSRARQEHKAILEACIARDAKLAARLTREHILGACQRYLEYLDAQAERATPPPAQRKPQAKGSAGSKTRAASRTTNARP